MGRLLRILFTGVWYAFAGLVVLLVVWFVANRLLDEAPDARSAALAISKSERVPDSQNIAIGILGLTAPRGTDVIAYGKSVLAAYRNGTAKKMRDMETAPNTLQPTVNSDQVTCWLSPDDPPVYKDCLPFDRAPATLEANNELLERYRALYRLPALQADYVYYTRAYLVLSKLAVAQMQLDLQRGDYASAYERWREEFDFIRRSLRGTDTGVGKIISTLKFGFAFPFFEDLFVANPRFVLEHRADLEELLKPDAIGEFINPQGMVKSEYGLVADSLDGSKDSPSSRTAISRAVMWLAQRNRVLNRYARFQAEYEQALVQPWPEMGQRFEALRRKYVENVDGWDFAIDPVGTLYVAILVDGNLKSRDLATQWILQQGRLRLATLALQAYAAKISDADMPKFLADAAPALRDPFNNQPMRWDAKNRRIYFPDPSIECSIVSQRVPSQSGATPPRAEPRICD